MVYSSPVKRSALGSISSILNTTPKTPGTKTGGVGKSATPRVAGIRQKLANLFSGNKENSPRKRDLLHCAGYTPNNAGCLDGKAFVGRDEDRDAFMMEIDSIRIGKEGGVLELRVASVVDVFSPNTRDQQQSTMTASSTASISPEVRQIAAALKGRLRLASYKISTQQIHTPLSELSSLPTQSPSDAVSQAIQQFRESTRMQHHTKLSRSSKLEIACRRDSRRTRRTKISASSTTIAADLAKKYLQLPRLPQPVALSRTVSMLSTIHSEEDAGLPSPPDSQQTNKSPLLPTEVPSTPAPKRKTRKLRRRRVYDETNGHLGLSSPPQQAYDRPDVAGDWEVEVGDDVPSSVLRGVECLWALTG